MNPFFRDEPDTTDADLDQQILSEVRFSPVLPARFRGTDRHLYCKQLYMLQLLTVDHQPLRPVVFLGQVIAGPGDTQPDPAAFRLTRKGDIVYALLAECGYQPGLHIAPRVRFRRYRTTTEVEMVWRYPSLFAQGYTLDQVIAFHRSEVWPNLTD